MKANRILTLFLVAIFSAFVSVLIISNLASAKRSTGHYFNQTQTKEVEKIIHNYIVSNPEILVEATQVLQQREQSKEKAKAEEAISKNAKAFFNSPLSPTIGNPEGNVTVIEFLDHQCQHCKEAGIVVDNLIKNDPQLRVVFKILPIFGTSSTFAAKAAIASVQQGTDKFILFHNALLKEETALTNEKVLVLAKAAGLDMPKLEKDMNHKEVMDQIQENFKLAQEMGLMGTPAFVAGNRKGTGVEYVPGAVNLTTLQKAIDDVRKK